jgi:hypothetical protein
MTKAVVIVVLVGGAIGCGSVTPNDPVDGSAGQGGGSPASSGGSSGHAGAAGAAAGTSGAGGAAGAPGPAPCVLPSGALSLFVQTCPQAGCAICSLAPNAAPAPSLSSACTFGSVVVNGPSPAQANGGSCQALGELAAQQTLTRSSDGTWSETNWQTCTLDSFVCVPLHPGSSTDCATYCPAQ